MKNQAYDPYENTLRIQRERIAREIKEREAEETEREEMIAAGYVEETITEYIPEWDGEGGDYVTESRWIKDPNRAEINNVHASDCHASNAGFNYEPSIIIEQYTLGDGTWDAVVKLSGAQTVKKYGFETREETEAWAKAQVTPNSAEDDGDYSQVPASTTHQINHATVTNGVVTHAWMDFLYSRLEGDNTLHSLIGLPVNEIKERGFLKAPSNEVIEFVNRAEGYGSSYGFYKVAHGNKNVPTQSFKVHGRKRS
jgi:hypothetical protein